MATTTQSATPIASDRIRIPVAAIVPDRVMGIPLYVADSSRINGCRLYRGPDYPLTLRDLEKLVKNQVTHLYIESCNRREFQDYLREDLTETLADVRLSGQKRFAVLNLVVRDVLCDSFERGDEDELVKSTHELAQHTVGLMCQRNVVKSSLSSVLCHDYETFTHSANVSFYSVLLAQALGMTDAATLEQIAVAGFLHDVGKLEISDRILTKPGKLTDDEFAVIKRHPTSGFLRLSQRPDLSFGQLMMVYQHHERLDGKGYPVGVAEDEIHPWARICSVADVYEALTSNRPYRKSMTQREALAIMDRGVGSAFDEEIYRCWVSTISILPK